MTQTKEFEYRGFGIPAYYTKLKLQYLNNKIHNRIIFYTIRQDKYFIESFKLLNNGIHNDKIIDMVYRNKTVFQK